MKADVDTEKAVVAFLDAFTGAYKRRDMDALMALIAPDDDVFMFGTGIDEKRIGPEEFRLQAERDWSQMEDFSFNFS